MTRGGEAGEPSVIAQLRAEGDIERVGASREVSQERIDAFAAATDDHNWMHVDPERAAAELPGGRTIAHGFLLLALTVADDVARWSTLPGISNLFNYGLNKVRFLSPVASGEAVRVRTRLRSLEPRSPGQWLMVQEKAVETTDGRCVVVAEQLTLVVLAEDRTEGATR